ncbi:MAG: S1/P1 nuclease [Burkholderiaceae bacterium]
MVTIAAIVTFTVWTSCAFAWSQKAHAMVGDIATRLLSPAATLAVAELLRDDLGADGKPSGRATLGQVASWPDEVRSLPEYRATYPYHFDDIPICSRVDPDKDRAKYCRDGQCATAWFDKQLAILKDESADKRARNEALKWIVHLVGDLHQPLHASDDEDKGGNDVKITFFGKRMDDPVEGRTQYPYNLHAAWDRLIPYRMFDERGGYDSFLADLPSEATRNDWEVGNIDLWTMESYVVARDFIYPALPTGFMCGRPITVVEALDEPYYRPAAEIAAAQIRKAGVRLAKVLNEAWVER